MSTNQSLGFDGLYKGMWSVFTSCYGAVLGWSLLLSLVMSLVLIVSFVVPLWAGLPPIFFQVCSWLLTVLVFIPLAAHLKYDVVRRARHKRATNGSSPELAKPNMYGSVVLVGLFQLVLLLPALIVSSAAVPNEFGAFTQNQPALRKLISGVGKNGPVEEKEQQAKAAGKKDKANQLQKDAQEDAKARPSLFSDSVQPILAVLFFLLMIIAGVAALTWIPWAWIALLDPRTDVTSAGAALRYARELTAGTCSGPIRWSILGVLIVTGIIGGGSVLLCCIGYFFLGAPLTLAYGPGLYLAMRGE